MKQNRGFLKGFNMYRPHIEGAAQARYYEKKKDNGLKDCHIWMTPQQWEVVKTIAQCVRKIKDIDDVIGIDISPNNKEFKIITDKSARKMLLTQWEDESDTL